ncbi:hypothetical protein OH77DRAFT_1432370 [Trametes cingulata]|nr:hypothetical protein OH77DRAFT_1432370 [Trametes cingulata]
MLVHLGGFVRELTTSSSAQILAGICVGGASIAPALMCGGGAGASVPVPLDTLSSGLVRVTSLNTRPASMPGEETPPWTICTGAGYAYSG